MPKSRKNPRKKINPKMQPSNRKDGNFMYIVRRMKFHMKLNENLIEVDQELFEYTDYGCIDLVNESDTNDRVKFEIEVTNLIDAEFFDKKSPFRKKSFASEILWILNENSSSGRVQYYGFKYNNDVIERFFSSTCYKVDGNVYFEILERLDDDNVKIIMICYFQWSRPVTDADLISLSERILFQPNS